MKMVERVYLTAIAILVGMYLFNAELLAPKEHEAEAKAAKIPGSTPPQDAHKEGLREEYAEVRERLFEVEAEHRWASIAIAGGAGASEQAIYRAREAMNPGADHSRAREIGQLKDRKLELEEKLFMPRSKEPAK